MMSGTINFVVDDDGNTRCGFEVVLPSGGVQKGLTDLPGALTLLGVAFPQSAKVLRAFAAQQAAPSSTSTSTTTSSGSTATVAVNTPVLNIGAKL